MEEFATNAAVSQRTQRADRPLLGLTILLVEDSRYFSDAVRLMAIRSGARLRRADCLHSARKHIRIYRPDAVLVDLGLPDGSGQDFIKEIATAPNAPPVIAMSGEIDVKQQSLSLGAGAAMYLQKPFFDLASFQQTVLSVLPLGEAPSSFRPRIVGEAVHPDNTSLSEDLGHIREILGKAVPDSDAHRIRYCAQFLVSLAQVSGDTDLIKEAEVLQARLINKDKWQNCCNRLLVLLDQRLAA